jgi:TP901 family phage tail tape measure protein
MANNLNYVFNFEVKGSSNVRAAVTQMGNGIVQVENAAIQMNSAFNSTINNISQRLGRIRWSATVDQINRVADGLNALAAPGLKLSTSMYDLQAMTGVAGDKLQEIEGYARANAKTFGGDAAASVESYKLVLSQLSPEIAQTPAALQAMGNSISILSKTMGGNTVAATETLTTAMNQYQVSLADPMQASQTMAQMMNVMAAAAQEGSAELPQIKAALENAGMAAKGAGVSFEETNAAIQVLDKAGKKGAEGGMALRNVLAIMGQGRFMPKDTQKALQQAGIDVGKLADNSLPLAQRLKMLIPVMNDGALVTKLFGMENKNAAVALLSQVPELERHDS